MSPSSSTMHKRRRRELPAHPHMKKAELPLSVPLYWESPDSSSIASSSYNPATEELIITFKRAGGSSVGDTPTYSHAKFPAELWGEFTAAESKGAFFNQMIRPRFPGSLVKR